MANTTGKKFGGRRKGTPNKLTAEMREALRTILEGEIDKLPALLDSLKPEKRVEMLARFLPFILPSKVEMETGPKDIVIEFKE